MPSKGTVLLTGVTGFIGSHTTIALLNAGYRVVGTLRDASRSASIREVISRHTDAVDQLELREANLMDESCWVELTKGVDFVQHIASPFPEVLPKDENELIKPAVKGTLAILGASSANHVKRVVLTSSSGAIAYGKTKDELKDRLDEDDWTNMSNTKDLTPYFKSKTLAERAAWDFVANDNGEMELVTICPTAVLGPLLEPDYSASANIVVKTMQGGAPALPDIGFDLIDVRSLAELYLKAMESPAATNERFIATSGRMTFQEIAGLLKEQYPDFKIPQGRLPNWFVRLFANFETSLKPLLLELGKERKFDGTKAQNVLQWIPRAKEQAVLDCAKSAVKLGLVG